MTRTFLLEIGVEELPVSFLHGAVDAIGPLLGGLLDEHRLKHGAVQSCGTPRRIAVLVEALAASQEDLDQEVVGPPKRAALDPDGAPTKAGIGFAKKHGLPPEALTVVTTDKGEYVAVRRQEVGGPAEAILSAVVPEVVRRLPFPKSMRWGTTELAFGRPIQWLVALLDDAVVEAEIAQIHTGRSTRGHRFLAPEAFDLGHAGVYVEALRAAHVLVDPADRERSMATALASEARKLGGQLQHDAFLLRECASLVEEPFVVPGAFDEAFLDLPDEVIVSVMRDHQRYFAVRKDGGELLPKYLNVVNTARDPETIQRGNDRVLRARLADAQFFVNEDRKTPLADRVAELDRVVFQKKLGSIGDKVRRLRRVAEELVSDAERGAVGRASELCKVDLVTLVIGEFPELQGEMGRFYALEQGEPAEVADALRDHYLPKGAGDELPQARVSAAVAVADRIDTLVGCFGLGLTPSGSADPFALRRAMIAVLRIALDGPFEVDFDLRTLAESAYDQFPEGVLKEKAAVLESLEQFLRGRLRALVGEEQPGELVSACLGAWDGRRARDFRARLEALAAFRQLPAYESLAVAFKRAHNITREAPEGEPDPALFAQDEEKALASSFEAVRPILDGSLETGNYEAAFHAVASQLKDPVDAFFDKVLVMDGDESVRDNRLRLLSTIAGSITRLAHFHEL